MTARRHIVGRFANASGKLILLAAAVGAGALAPPSAVAEWTGPCVSGPAVAGVPPSPPGTEPICRFSAARLKWIDDGDTIDVKLSTWTGKTNVARVRIIGINAMEQTRYDSRPRKRRGECHAVRATARLETLLRRAHGRVRLGAQDPESHSRERLWRSVAVKIGGAWRDVGRRLIAEGHALWLPSWNEYGWNATYADLAQRAARKGVNLWDTDACGSGPSQDANLAISVHPDGQGTGSVNANREWVTIQNLGSAAPVSLAGWSLRDSLARYRFPSSAVLPPGGRITVYVGPGSPTPDTLFWGLHRTIFENPAPDGRAMGDGAYLVDPDGDLRAWAIYPCYVACSAPARR